MASVVVLTSTQRGVWGRVVGGLQDADREQLRKVCKTTAAVECMQAWLPRWVEVVPPERRRRGRATRTRGAKTRARTRDPTRRTRRTKTKTKTRTQKAILLEELP